VSQTGAFQFWGEFWHNRRNLTGGGRKMKRTHEQLRAELLAAAEEVIDELLEWHEGTGAPTLIEIEDEVLKLRQRMGVRMASVVIADQAMVRPVPGPSCASCEQEMRYKDMKTVTVEGQLGVTKIERAYYYCDRCRSGLFPPRSAVEFESEALE